MVLCIHKTKSKSEKSSDQSSPDQFSTKDPFIAAGQAAAARNPDVSFLNNQTFHKSREFALEVRSFKHNAFRFEIMARPKT